MKVKTTVKAGWDTSIPGTCRNQKNVGHCIQCCGARHQGVPKKNCIETCQNAY